MWSSRGKEISKAMQAPLTVLVASESVASCLPNVIVTDLSWTSLIS